MILVLFQILVKMNFSSFALNQNWEL